MASPNVQSKLDILNFSTTGLASIDIRVMCHSKAAIVLHIKDTGEPTYMRSSTGPRILGLNV